MGQGHYTQLGRLTRQVDGLQSEVSAGAEQQQRYLQLLQGATGGAPSASAAATDYTSYDFVSARARFRCCVTGIVFALCQVVSPLRLRGIANMLCVVFALSSLLSRQF